MSDIAVVYSSLLALTGIIAMGLGIKIGRRLENLDNESLRHRLRNAFDSVNDHRAAFRMLSGELADRHAMWSRKNAKLVERNKALAIRVQELEFVPPQSSGFTGEEIFIANSDVPGTRIKKGDEVQMVVGDIGDLVGIKILRPKQSMYTMPEGWKRGVDAVSDGGPFINPDNGRVVCPACHHPMVSGDPVCPNAMCTSHLVL